MLQRLNLAAPERNVPDPTAQSTAGSHESILVSRAKAEEVHRRTNQILASGEAPDWLFVCRIRGNLLTFQPGLDKKPAILLFTTPYKAQDYLRATGTEADIAQLKLESLPEMARTWTAAGCDAFILNRCPRCKIFLLSSAKLLLSKEGFLACWAADRAAKVFQGELLVRSASAHIVKKLYAQARTELEQIRDHIDCGIPYLHQMIGLVADVQGDEPARISAAERLKEFGPQFDGVTKFSPHTIATAIVGLMMNFGMMQIAPSSGRDASDSSS